MPILVCEVSGHTVPYRVYDLDDNEIAVDSRMQEFVRRYVAHWIRKHGKPPRLHHLLPFQYKPTFLLDFGYVGEFARENPA